MNVFLNNVENIYLTESEDLGSMSEDDVKLLRKDLKKALLVDQRVLAVKENLYFED